MPPKYKSMYVYNCYTYHIYIIYICIVYQEALLPHLRADSKALSRLLRGLGASESARLTCSLPLSSSTLTSRGARRRGSPVGFEEKSPKSWWRSP